MTEAEIGPVVVSPCQHATGPQAPLPTLISSPPGASMRTICSLLALFACAALCTSFPFASGAEQPKPEKIKALIVDGKNNHAWQKTTPVLKAALESSGLFTVDVATSPPHGQKMDGFQPDFAHYGVVVSNYNGDEWPETTKPAFAASVRNGGGFVC